MRGFTAFQVGEIAGVNRKTLHHWAKTGSLPPSVQSAQGTGTRRRYSFSELVAVRVARELRKAGFSLSTLRKTVTFLRKQKFDQPLAEAYLVSDGMDIHLVHDSGTPFSVVIGAGQGCFRFVLEMSAAVSEINRRADAFVARQSTGVISTNVRSASNDRSRQSRNLRRRRA